MGVLEIAIKKAYCDGYRITDNGNLYGKTGKQLKIVCRGKQRYPTFSISGVPNVKNKYGVFGIPVHKFAAYCFYGDDIWKFDCVRHLDGNVLNLSKSNIVLGSNSENNMDKSRQVRSRAARTARGSQPYRAINAKLNTSQVLKIIHSQKSASSLAAEYNVSRVTIYNIKNGKTYKDIGES